MERKTRLEKLERVIPLASHVAQVLMMLMTAGGFFFTVIPLYQKAAVDEQVAKQKIKLEELESKVAVNYKKYRAETIRKYVYLTGTECVTGLMFPIQKIGEKQPGPDLNDQILAINVSDCMRRDLSRTIGWEDLTEEDKKTLFAATNDIAAEIDIFRLTTKAKISSIQPNLKAAGPLELGMGEFAETEILLMKKAGATDDEIKILVSQLSVGSQRNDLTAKYSASALSKIKTLNQLIWPADRAD